MKHAAIWLDEFSSQSGFSREWMLDFIQRIQTDAVLRFDQPHEFKRTDAYGIDPAYQLQGKITWPTNQ